MILSHFILLHSKSLKKCHRNCENRFTDKKKNKNKKIRGSVKKFCHSLNFSITYMYIERCFKEPYLKDHFSDYNMWQKLCVALRQ